MAAKKTIPATRLYIGEWLTALGMEAKELAAAVPMNEGYLSGLISGNKTGMRYSMLYRIADCMGISADQLRRRPPTKAELGQLSGLDPAVIARLHRRR